LRTDQSLAYSRSNLRADEATILAGYLSDCETVCLEYRHAQRLVTPRMPLSMATISKLSLPPATVEAAVTARYRSPHIHSAEYRFWPIRCRVGFGMGIALCFCMSTSLQLLALCLAFVGSLIFALALARIILKVLFAVICRGLPTPHNGRGKRVVHSADYQSHGTKARASSECRAVVRHPHGLRLLEDRASFRTHRRSERRVAPLTTSEGLSKSGNGHPMASP
jgi:hypothetical protein